MPKFPVYQRQVGLSGGATASYASDGAMTAPARALAGAGDAMFRLGGDIMEGESRIRQTQDDTWFSKARAQTAVDMIGIEREAQQGATEGARDYTPTIRARFDEVRKARASQAPSERAARIYDEWATGYDVDLTQRASSFQAQSELTQRAADFSEAMNAHAQAVYADPSQYGTVLKRAMDDFEGARQWMTPEQETKSREQVDHSLKLARVKSLVEFAPDEFLKEVGASSPALRGGDAVTAVVDRIIGAESAGNANAQNPRSSASGLGQFTDGTWLETIKKHRPDIAAVMGDREILGLKTDPRLGREMTARLTEDNARALEASGMPVNAGTLYLAHFAGIGGARKVLTSPREAGIGDVLGAGVVSANPFLAGKSAGWLMDWAAKKMGGAPVNVPNNPLYAGLSIDEIASLQNSALASVNKQQAASYAAAKDSLELGIATGAIAGEDQILSSGLNGGDIATLLGKLRTAQEDGRNLAGAWQAWRDGSLSMDSYSTRDRNLLDKMEASIPEGETMLRDAWANEAIARTGIVPRGALSGILRGLEGGNAQEVADAAARAASINAIDRSALAKRENGATAADAGTAFDHFVNTVGLSPEQAGQRLIDMKDPEKVKARAALMDTKPIKDFVKAQATENAVRDIFDPGVFGFDPTLGETPAEAAAMVGEYRDMLEESIFDAAGDTGLAQTLAGQRFRRLYGASDLTLSGSEIVTRLPPENTYPPGPDGSHDYVRVQLEAALRQEGVEFDEVFLQSDDMTDADFRAGRPARYQVFYRQGSLLERYNLPFYAMPDAGTDFSVNRGRRDQNMQDVTDGRDREGNLDRFLDADPLTGR